MIPGFILVKFYYKSDHFWFSYNDRNPNMYLKTSFDQLVAFLQVLQPNFSLWAIMAQPCVITSFQSSCEIGLNAQFSVHIIDMYKQIVKQLLYSILLNVHFVHIV